MRYIEAVQGLIQAYMAAGYTTVGVVKEGVETEITSATMLEVGIRHRETGKMHKVRGGILQHQELIKFLTRGGNIERFPDVSKYE